jgi:hypothetical protein
VVETVATGTDLYLSTLVLSLPVANPTVHIHSSAIGTDFWYNLSQNSETEIVCMIFGNKWVLRNSSYGEWSKAVVFNLLLSIFFFFFFSLSLSLSLSLFNFVPPKLLVYNSSYT